MYCIILVNLIVFYNKCLIQRVNLVFYELHFSGRTRDAEDNSGLRRYKLKMEKYFCEKLNSNTTWFFEAREVKQCWQSDSDHVKNAKKAEPG